MSFRQKTALVSALALLAAYGWYFAQVARARTAGSLSDTAMLGLVLPTILAVVLIQVAGAVLIAIFSGERQAPMDERERALSANAIRGAYAVCSSSARLRRAHRSSSASPPPMSPTLRCWRS